MHSSKALFTSLISFVLLLSGQKQSAAQEIEMGLCYGQKISAGGSSDLGLMASYSWELTDTFYLGLGAGYLYNDGNHVDYFPVYLRTKYYFAQEESTVRPFTTLDIGYAFSFENEFANFNDHDHSYHSQFGKTEENAGGFLMTPSVGIALTLLDELTLDFGAGYRMQWIPEHSLDQRKRMKRQMSGALQFRIGVTLKL